MNLIQKYPIITGTIIILILIIVALILYKKNVDGSKGGLIIGPSHDEGGIKTEIKGVGGKLEVEGNEYILTKGINKLTSGSYICSGTPVGIASAINVISGGVSFAENGKCYQK